MGSLWNKPGGWRNPMMLLEAWISVEHVLKQVEDLLCSSFCTTVDEYSLILRMMPKYSQCFRHSTKYFKLFSDYFGATTMSCNIRVSPSVGLLNFILSLMVNSSLLGVNPSTHKPISSTHYSGIRILSSQKSQTGHAYDNTQREIVN
ncbi:replicase polyprotein 1ab [Striga asiatica]|uniref:Replicase polyprotein 1ab n=1 Tax=Striga asiatica TaxID=4170 RepID=A0A5A7P8V3_STRAF|nr:replicase polyprotein 1ab [Striga asiatica]